LRDAVPLILRRRNVQVVDYLTALEDFLQPVRINLLTVPRKIDRRLLLSRFEESCRLPGGTIAGILPAGDGTPHTSLENASLPLQRLLVLLSMNQAMAGRQAARPGCSPESWSNSIAVPRCLLDLLRQVPCESLQPATLPAELLPAATDLGRRIVRWVEARSAHVYGDLRDVWDGNEAPGGQSGDGVPPLNEAEITRTAIRYWAETASELQNTITELETAREYWREEAIKWEELGRRLTNSWSWRLTKPLRLARFLQSILKLQHAREGS
jgi:hypothetical protein